MKVNGQLKNAQLEIVQKSTQSPGTKARIVYDTECESACVDTGTSFERVLDNRDMPTGSIMMFPIQPPAAFGRYLLADGSTLLIADYLELYGVLGTSFGGDGVTTFHLPDYRGVFLRGTDRGRGLDCDSVNRTDRGDGTVGDVVGTFQGDGVGPHQHNTSDAARIGSGLRARFDSDINAINAEIVNTVESTTNPTVGGACETRPKNVNVDFYVKVK